ncbi:reverse transcriptase domain-containing protein [Tanacetum coccineum]
MEAYVDDMVIKSMDEQDMLEDIQETFESLKRTKTIKEVQNLNGKLVALNRFLSKSAEKSLPFFKTLKECLEKKDFTWTMEADKAFEEIKKYIEKLPTLVAPKAGEGLIVYLAASKEYISAVLMAERGKDQRPIYFISIVLQGAELNYPTMEKFVLALIHAARRLKRYFQAHKITILTNIPIRLLLLKPKKSGRVARWAIELGEHKIEFKPRNAIKAQILAETQEEDDETDLQSPEKKGERTGCKLYTDGASTSDGFGAGPKQTRSVIKEIHGGSCGLHAGPRSIMAKITTLGYYWPSMHKDSAEIIQSCDACQIHSPISRLPKQEMTSVTAAWPFTQWGIDIIGPKKSKIPDSSGGLLH